MPAATASEHPPFVSPDRLRERLGEVVLADVRWSLDGTQGRAQHLEQTLPGAVYVDLDAVLAAAPAPSAGRHPLPDPARFAAELGRLGIGVTDEVVVLDHGPGVVAARLAWLLRAIGQRAAVLEGGLAAWPGPRAPGGAIRPAVERPVVAWPEDRLADADLVDRLRRDPDAVVVDARDPDRYRGEVEPIDPRPGHVPGAVNLPASAAVRDGRLRTGWLRERYAAVGALEATEVVAYCGSGVTACFDLLVLEQLGAGPGRLYAGSWSAWSADPSRPAALGPDPGGDRDGALGL
jgi:thiosulfate/3-mercaptopyruvate sulfurtransferase